jgi:protein tyrosine phosphatase (PTP) superfamily phosphohydrolase (DUF442 family)
MPTARFIPNKLKPWIEARQRFRLSDAQVQMARELGMNPKKLGGIANHQQERWKMPLPQFIEDCYEKQFHRKQPQDIRSIEEKEAEKRARKNSRRAERSAEPFYTIKNFYNVSPELATAGQPSENELREIAASGFDVVINLGLLDPSYCLPDEMNLVASLGMEYVHIPVIFSSPHEEELWRFFAVMELNRDKKVFVHCAMNYRASAFVALYGQAKLGWSREVADTHAKRFWELDDVWSGFIEKCREKIAENS